MSLNLTREQTIKKHRKMWNWIAYETLKRKRKVLKEDYFEEHGISMIPYCECYCCDYDYDYSIKYDSYRCKACPIIWPDNMTCPNDNSLYEQFYSCRNKDYKEAAELARQIAELPEKEVKE